MRISLKLTAAFLAIASLVGAAGYLAQRTTDEVRGQIGRLKESAVPRIAGAAQTTAALYAIQLAAHQWVAVQRQPASTGEAAPAVPSRPGRLDEQRARVDQGLERVRQAVESHARWEAQQGVAGPAAARPGNPSVVSQLQEKWLAHQRLLGEVQRMAEADAERADEFLENVLWRQFERELLPLLSAQRDRSERELTEAINGVERSLAKADTQRSLLTLAAAASAVLIGLGLSRSIGRPLGMLRRAAQDVGRGRLDTRVPVGSHDEIGILGQALNQMAADLQERTVSRSYLENILRSMRDMLIVTDAEARICRLNPAACGELGCDPLDLIGRPLWELFRAEGVPREPLSSWVWADGVESVMHSRSQGLIPVLCSVAPIRDDQGRLEGAVCVASNISRQKDTEQRLLDSLREKELLLKELHHRVKNNLQVISSLLELQAQELSDPRTIRLFQESQGRVRSLALVHEQLYRSEDLSQVDFAAYVRELVERLAQGPGTAAARVRLDFELAPCQLPLDVAIPCGMIVNELVANALEHAFPAGRSGAIRIAFRELADGYILTVADDGVGLPAGLLTGKPGTLGLKVVQALTRQIRGRLELQPEAGAVFTLRFAAPAAPAAPESPPRTAVGPSRKDAQEP